MHAINFLTAVARSVHFKLFEGADTLRSICESIVIPNLRMREDMVCTAGMYRLQGVPCLVPLYGWFCHTNSTWLGRPQRDGVGAFGDFASKPALEARVSKGLASGGYQPACPPVSPGLPRRRRCLR